MNGSFAFRLMGMALVTGFAGLSLAACGTDANTTTSSSTSGGGGEGGGSGGAGGGGGGGVTGKNGEAYAAAYCGRSFDCCNAADIVERFTSSHIVDYAGCRIYYRTIWEAAVEPIVVEGEKAGRVEFSQANFDACMKSVEALSCADFKQAPTFCENIFTPKVALGQPCFSSIECVDGLCDIPQGASVGMCMKKPAPVMIGGACQKPTDCADGLYCNAMTCQPQKADGQSCTNDRECLAGTCIGDAQGGMGQCGKICEGGGPGAGKIDEALETLGGPLVVAECNKFFECCSGDEIDTVLFPGIRAESQCYGLLGLFLGIGLVDMHNSSAEGKLQIDGTKLQACIGDFASLTCAAFAKDSSFACDGGITGLVADGASCTDDNQCTSKYCNEPMPNQGKCATPPGAGAPCTDQCADGFYCDGAMCAPQKALGSMCATKDECLEGRCYGPSGMKTCALVCDGI